MFIYICICIFLIIIFFFYDPAHKTVSRSSPVVVAGAGTLITGRYETVRRRRVSRSTDTDTQRRPGRYRRGLGRVEANVEFYNRFYWNWSKSTYTLFRLSVNCTRVFWPVSTRSGPVRVLKGAREQRSVPYIIRARTCCRIFFFFLLKLLLWFTLKKNFSSKVSI